MNTYYVIWHFSANYSTLLNVEAQSPEEAARKATGIFSKDFRNNGTVYVFDKPPVVTINAGKDK